MRRTLASFAEQVAERLKTKATLGPVLESPTTPAVLRMLGFPEAPLVMSPTVLLKLATGKSGQRPPLTEWQIARLPEYIDDPVLVVKDEDDTVIVLSETTSADKPVIICVRAHCAEGFRVVNSIRTAFGKDRPEEWLERHRGDILYVGEKNKPPVDASYTDLQSGWCARNRGSKPNDTPGRGSPQVSRRSPFSKADGSGHGFGRKNISAIGPISRPMPRRTVDFEPLVPSPGLPSDQQP